jgi:hypothetical protein
VAEDEKRSRGEHWLSLMDEAGVSRGRRRIHFIVSLTLMLLMVAAVVLIVVGIVIGGPLVWLGIALFIATSLLLIVTGLRRRRLIDDVRWQEGTATVRAVEPGSVGETGQYVVCEFELDPGSTVARLATTIGPMDAERLIVGASMRCLIDRMDSFTVLRAFPYAAAEDPLPSGRALKFNKT